MHTHISRRDNSCSNADCPTSLLDSMCIAQIGCHGSRVAHNVHDHLILLCRIWQATFLGTRTVSMAGQATRALPKLWQKRVS